MKKKHKTHFKKIKLLCVRCKNDINLSYLKKLKGNFTHRILILYENNS